MTYWAIGTLTQNDGSVAILENGERIAKVWGEANARRIVAAPDLLEACKEALLWYGPDGVHVADPARPLLVAAIRRAEGQ